MQLKRILDRSGCKKMEGETFFRLSQRRWASWNREYLVFFPLVFCENRNITLLKEVFEKELQPKEIDQHQLLLRSLINDGSKDIAIEEVENPKATLDNIKVKFITHQGGCGSIRQDAEVFGKTFSRLCKQSKCSRCYGS